MSNRTGKFMWFMWEGVGASSWFMWIVSSFLSYWGLTNLAPNLPAWVKYIAIGFAVIINFVEFMIDQKGWAEFWRVKTVRDFVLRMFAVTCYLYDVLTNVLGFLVILHAGLNVVVVAKSLGISQGAVTVLLDLLAFAFGFCFAAGPEPVYLEYLEKKFPYPGTAPLKDVWSSLIGKRANYYNKPSQQAPRNQPQVKQGKPLSEYLQEQFPHDFGHRQ